MKIAATIEPAFTALLAAALEGVHVLSYESRTEDMDDYAACVRAFPEEVWLRDAAGRAMGFSVEIEASALGYVEDIKEDEAAFRDFASGVRDALYELTAEQITAELPAGWTVSQYSESETADRSEEGNYDRWAASAVLHIVVTEAGS